ncbi:hypothetical protein DIPPA_25497 [Diplonema papillatum]|nr:hypothetical protein DIPPA_25497 [Diplonema papillatum]
MEKVPQSGLVATNSARPRQLQQQQQLLQLPQQQQQQLLQQQLLQQQPQQDQLQQQPQQQQQQQQQQQPQPQPPQHPQQQQQQLQQQLQPQTFQQPAVPQQLPLMQTPQSTSSAQFPVPAPGLAGQQPVDSPPPCNTLYVSNIDPTGASEAQLRAIFETYPGLKRLTIHGTQAWALFDQPAQAAAGLVLNNRQLTVAGTRLRVTYARAEMKKVVVS